MPVQDSTSTRERTATARCVERLSHYETRLACLIRLCDPGLVIDSGDATPLFTSTLHREVRDDLRRDYDAGDQRALSAAQFLTQSALYGAYAELSPGPIPRSSRMLAEARKAQRVIQAALAEVKQGRSR